MKINDKTECNHCLHKCVCKIRDSMEKAINEGILDALELEVKHIINDNEKIEIQTSVHLTCKEFFRE